MEDVAKTPKRPKLEVTSTTKRGIGKQKTAVHQFFITAHINAENCTGIDQERGKAVNHFLSFWEVGGRLLHNAPRLVK